jgi:hypothetical protein
MELKNWQQGAEVSAVAVGGLLASTLAAIDRVHGRSRRSSSSNSMEPSSMRLDFRTVVKEIRWVVIGERKEEKG